jgi:hypothetical protein
LDETPYRPPERPASSPSHVLYIFWRELQWLSHAKIHQKQTNAIEDPEIDLARKRGLSGLPKSDKEPA